MRLLLISNSGRPYLEHCRPTISEFLGPLREVDFLPDAAFILPQDYMAKVQAALEPAGIRVRLVEEAHDRSSELRSGALLIGGGNTYKLLRSLWETRLIEPIRERVRAGMPIVGWSAGANVCGPTILTTNDWNVVGWGKSEALGFVPFNINPHYKETDPTMAPGSETRDDRIREYHCANSNTVLAIEENTSLWIEGEKIKVVGQGRVRRFERNQPPSDFRAGDAIRF